MYCCRSPEGILDDIVPIVTQGRMSALATLSDVDLSSFLMLTYQVE